MKWFKCVLAVLLLLGSAVPDVASADRGRHRSHDARTRLGIHIGVPLYWGWPSPYYAPSPRYPRHYYPYPPYYDYPPVIAIPSPPPVYVERDDDAAPDGDRAYWYYCYRPEGYYPYVKECPGGWDRVAPTPSR